MTFTPPELERFRLVDGDVLLAEASGSRAQVGRSAVWRGEIPECCFQNTIIRFRPASVTSAFAHLVFQYYALSGRFSEIARGIGILHLGTRRLAALSMPIPPRQEQARLSKNANRAVDGLSKSEVHMRSALRLIDRQRLAVLERARDGTILFTRGQKARRTRKAVGPPADAHGWNQATLAELGSIKAGKARNRERERGSPTPYLRVANVQEDYIDLSDVGVMPMLDRERDDLGLEVGDILINVSQSPDLVGRSAVVRQPLPGMAFQNHIVRFRAQSAVNPEFVQLVLRDHLHSGAFRQAARWTTNLATLRLSDLGAVAVSYPPLDQQQLIVDEARSRLAASSEAEDRIRASLAALSGLRLQALRAAVTGNASPSTIVPTFDVEGPSAVIKESAASNQESQGLPTAQLDLAVATPERVAFDFTSMASTKESSESSPAAARLLETLAASPELGVAELFSRAGFSRESVDEVEEFYLALRELLASNNLAVAGSEPEGKRVRVQDASP